MVILWDGFKSLLAAVAALVLCAGPALGALYAIKGWALPGWAVWPIGTAAVLLAGAGGVLVAAFLRKAWRGVSPARDRRR